MRFNFLFFADIFIFLVVILLFLPTIFAVDEILTEEFSSEIKIIGKHVGNVVYSYLDTNNDNRYDHIIIIDTVVGNVKIISFEKEIKIVKKFKIPYSDFYSIKSIKLKNNKNGFVIGGKILSLYDSNGNIIWTYNNIQEPILFITTLDLDNDDVDDRIVAVSWRMLMVFSLEGKMLWNYSKVKIPRGVDIFDFNKDGIGESIVLIEERAIKIFSPTGELIYSFGGEYFPEKIIKAKVLDINNDGFLREFLIIEKNGKIRFLSFNESKYVGKIYIEETSKDTSNIKIIPIPSERNIKNIGIFSEFLYVFDINGSLLWRYKGPALNDVAPIDFNEDGIYDGFIGATDKKIHAIKNNMQVGYYLIDSKKIAPYNKTGAKFVVSIDLDGNGFLDDILGIDMDNNIFVISHISKRISKNRIIIIANTIDYFLATDLFEYLRNAGYEPIHVFPNNFYIYRNETKIIILGGHKAPETGKIVEKLLTSQEKKELEKKGAIKKIILTDIWTPNQKIYIFAGNTRIETRQAHLLYRKIILEN